MVAVTLKQRGLLRSIKRLLFHSLVLIVGGASVFLCYVIRPIINIRFGHLHTSRIGHLCYNMDNYLDNRLTKRSKEWAVFSTDKKLSNDYIFSVWKKQKRIIFSKLAIFPTVFLNKYFPDSSRLISWRNELHPEISLTSSKISNFRELDDSNDGTQLAELEIAVPFVCFHNRDSAYLEQHGTDGNEHCYRDFDFDDFRSSIDRLAERGVSSVRLGEVVKSNSSITNQRFREITGSKRSDYLDVYLISRCQFFVGCSTGFSQITRLLRKPGLLVNYIPFRIEEFSAWAAGSIIVPKKLLKVSEQSYLRFSEMNNLKYDIHYQGDFFADHGLRVEDNSQEEIEDAVLEMYARIDGSWQDTAVQAGLQNEFWNSIGHKELAGTMRDQLQIGISSTFLEKNPDLI